MDPNNIQPYANQPLSNIKKTEGDFFALIEGISGAGIVALESLEAPKLALDSTKLMLRCVQAAFKGSFWDETKQMVRELQEKGRLLKNQDSEKVLEMGAELTRVVDSRETPDKEILNAARDLFLYGIMGSTNDDERYLAKRFLEITRDLHNDDILIFRGCYALYTKHKGSTNYPNDVDTWAKRVAEHIGHGIKYLVLNRENSLMAQNLIGSRTHADKSGIACADTGRLTDLGMRYCDFLEKASATVNDAQTP